MRNPGALTSTVCCPASTGTLVPHCPSPISTPSRFTTSPGSRSPCPTVTVSFESCPSIALARRSASAIRSASCVSCAALPAALNSAHALASLPVCSRQSPRFNESPAVGSVFFTSMNFGHAPA